MIDELDRLDDLSSAMCRRARAAGVMLVWRAQARATHRVLVRQGRTEETSSSSSSGHGIQVFTDEGYTALASRDDFDPDRGAELLDRAIRTATSGAALGLERNPPPALERVQARATPEGIGAFDTLPLDEVARRLQELEAEVVGRVPGPSVRLSFSTDLDAWRIARSDGTDVTFAMPRCVLRVAASSMGHGPKHTVGAAVFGPRPGLLWEEATVRLFLRRAEGALRLACDLPDAPVHPAGTFPLVIDYALAKGLAHEAFGHASEADSFRSSILAREGKFRTGEQVGAEHVSIIDDTIEGDHAWQPFSANGVPRGRAVLVDRGRLAGALSDPWTAGPGGIPLTGAERAESFRSAPLPRMSNVRIEVDEPGPAPGAFEDYGPAEVRDLLAAAGVLDRHPRLVYLSGYTGGQVNTATGDFMFNCKAIYSLTPRGIVLHRPAIFSGSMFGALASIREAFGPLLLDALGTCGKWGQSVPSSGGSHFFLVLEPHPAVRIGGS